MKPLDEPHPNPERIAAIAKAMVPQPKSRALWQRALASMPGGVPGSGSVTKPLYWDRGEGAYMYDIDGNRYLDMAAGQGSMILGNSIPEVRSAILAQADRSYYVQIARPEVVRLAELLCDRFPAVEQVRFVESGTKAANLAVRLGRAFSKKEKFAKFIGGYHGLWDGALVNPPIRYTGSTHYGGALPGVPRSTEGDVILLPYNEIEECERLIHQNRADLGTLIVEPVIGDGYLPPALGFLEALRDVCDELGIVLVFDEAITQSLSPGGAQQYFGVVPDLTTLAKGAIGGGLPLAAVGGRAEIMALLDPLLDGPHVPSGSTFASHALSVAAGLAQAVLLTPAVFERLHMLGNRLREGIKSVASSRGCTEFRVTGVGNLSFLHWNVKTPTTYSDHLECDGDIVTHLVSSLLEEGYITAGGGRIHTSASMDEDDIDGFLDALGRVLSAC